MQRPFISFLWALSYARLTVYVISINMLQVEYSVMTHIARLLNQFYSNSRDARQGMLGNRLRLILPRECGHPFGGFARFLDSLWRRLILQCALEEPSPG